MWAFMRMFFDIFNFLIVKDVFSNGRRYFSFLRMCELGGSGNFGKVV